MTLRILLAAFLLASGAAWAQSANQIPKSHATPNFVAAVTRYGNELAEWRGHMAKVEEDKKNHVPKDRAYQPFPAPSADPEVMASVDADGKPNYMIVNDDDEVLAAKKAALLARVSKEMDAAFNAVYPLGKRPLAEIREKDIEQRDAIQLQAILKTQSGILPSVGIGRKTPDEIAAEIAKARSADDAQFLQDQAARRAKIDAVHRAAAQMMSDIEDLTISNVDTYVIAPLPN